jgi:hypothetical protein
MNAQFAETFRFSYAVFKRNGDNSEQVGIVMANNLTLANTKAQRLYGRGAWAQVRSN